MQVMQCVIGDDLRNYAILYFLWDAEGLNGEGEVDGRECHDS